METWLLLPHSLALTVLLRPAYRSAHGLSDPSLPVATSTDEFFHGLFYMTVKLVKLLMRLSHPRTFETGRAGVLTLACYRSSWQWVNRRGINGATGTFHSLCMASSCRVKMSLTVLRSRIFKICPSSDDLQTALSTMLRGHLSEECLAAVIDLRPMKGKRTPRDPQPPSTLVWNRS